jgi:hypothetical protein
MPRKANQHSRGGTRTPDPLINRRNAALGASKPRRSAEGVARAWLRSTDAAVSPPVSRDLDRLFAVVPVGIGAPLPDLAEAADLTIARATLAINLLEGVGAVSCARRLAGSRTIELFSRAAA